MNLINFNQQIENYIFTTTKQNTVYFKNIQYFIELRYQLNELLHDVFDSKNKIHIIQYPTGIGKSTFMYIYLDYFYKLKVPYAVLLPEYENGVYGVDSILTELESYNFLIKKPMIFEGKKIICSRRKINGKKSRIQSRINTNANTIKDLITNKHPIDKFCNKVINSKTKEKCKDNCPYYINKKTILEKSYRVYTETDKIELYQPIPFVAVHHQLNKFLHQYLNFLKKHEELKVHLFIDENFLNGIKISNASYPLDLDLLNTHIEVLDNVRLYIIDMIMKKEEITENYNILNKFVDLLQDIFILLQQNILKRKIDHKELKYKITNLLIFILNNSNNIENLTPGYIRNNFNRIQKIITILICNDKIRLFKSCISDIQSLIINYLFFSFNNSNEHFNFLKYAIQLNKNKTHISLLFYDRYSIERIVDNYNIDKIIITDATANIEEYQFIFYDKQIQHHKAENLYPNFTWYQLCVMNPKTSKHDSEYSKRSLLQSSTRNNLLKDIKSIVDKFPNEYVLVVSRNISKEKLREYNPTIHKDLKGLVMELGNTKLFEEGNILFEEYPLSSTNDYSNINVIIILGTPHLDSHTINRESHLIATTPEKYKKNKKKENILQAIGRINRKEIPKTVVLLTAFNLELNVSIKKFYNHKSLRNFFSNNKSYKDKINKLKPILKKKGYVDYNDYMNVFNCSKPTSIKHLNKIVETNLFETIKIETNGRPLTGYRETRGIPIERFRKKSF